MKTQLTKFKEVFTSESRNKKNYLNNLIFYNILKFLK